QTTTGPQQEGNPGNRGPHRLPPRSQAGGAEPPRAARGWGMRSPEPARRPTGGPSSTGVPASVAPRAGPAPAQARTSASSPLRKRWQRTPPVARPLGGNSANGVTLTAPGSVPGRAVEEPLTVTTTDVAGSRAPNHTTECPATSLIPATPP